ncbi:MAG: chromate transporter [Spirochaetia bacterium]|jgi:chromate transporter|nr:chromate transporter [Spirochaetia bacterium]
MKKLLKLFTIFFRIGLFSIGGGYVMLPMLKEEVVNKRKWLTDEEILDFYAIGQATPGIIAVNTATFVGYSQKGIAGSLSATAGIVAPSIIIITMISAFFTEFREVLIVQKAFAGIRVAVSVLLLFIVAGLIKKGAKYKTGIVIMIAAFSGMAFFEISPVLIVTASAAAGILSGSLRRNIFRKRGNP